MKKPVKKVVKKNVKFEPKKGFDYGQELSEFKGWANEQIVKLQERVSRLEAVIEDSPKEESEEEPIDGIERELDSQEVEHEEES